jgi:peptidyl-prolyl cis-trans isomerase B (cyclophilin B)
LSRFTWSVSLGFTLSVWLGAFLIAGEASGASAPELRVPPGKPESQPPPPVGPPGKLPRAVLETDRGSITLELFPDVAPKTVARFIELSKKGFYNGLTFRVVPKFLIQTGDPLGDGTGGSGQSLPAEFNEKNHGLGTIAMARKHEPDSADSQFYICLESQPFLDGNYTVFGQVSEGLEILPKIQERDIVRKLTLKP